MILKDVDVINVLFMNNDHFCFYVPLRRFSREHASGRAWIERCRCGRSIVSDCKFIVDGQKSPQMTKTWFDRDGNIERVTGYKPDN